MAEKKVLIVEDDIMISGFLEKKLVKMGYTLLAVANNGLQAIEYANLHRPDLIMMDVILEGDLDGIKTVEQITKFLDVPIVYLTTSTDEQTIDRLMKTEPHGFLIKPFDERILFSAINIAIYRHKTKKELSDTKEMLRTTIESIDDMVFGLDMDGNFIHNHSGNLKKLPRFNTENITGKSIKDVFPYNVARKLSEAMQWVKDYNKAYSVEFSLDDQDFQYWYNSKMTIRKDHQGKISGITMVISDITENKNMYQELLLSQQKLSEAQNIARLGSCDFFLKEKKFVFNEIYFDLLGITDDEEIRRFNEEKMVEIIHPDDRSRYKLMRKQVKDEKRTDFSINFRIPDKNDTLRYLHLVGQMKYDKKGRPIRMLNTLQDITWQKTTEKLKHDVELAQKTAVIKQTFFARLSHEIRNPITGILGLIYLLETTDLNEKQRNYLMAMQSSSDTLLNLLNDVLDYSKIESGMLKVKPSEFDIRNTIKNIYTFFIPNALEKDLQFKYTLADHLPEKIIADENKIIQIFSNLLSNAFKFTDKGSVEMHIDFEKSTLNDESIMLKIEIEDTGSGIRKEDKNRLFKDYAQIEHEGYTKNKGSGLGLAICKQLVELMDGQIGIENGKNGVGSKFWFKMPVIAVALQVDLQPEKAIAPLVEREKLNCSVLLVEDMIVNQKVIKLLLEDMGCKVAIATNGLEAIEMYKETVINAFDIFGKIHYDIILMDHIMPVMDGYTAFKRLKSEFETLPPVILLTADESFAKNNSFREKGFDDCIIKPVKGETLHNTLKKHLQSGKSTDSQERLEMNTNDEIEQKPVINPNTLELIIGHAKKNNFNIRLLFESFFDDMNRIQEQSMSAIEMNDYNSLKLIVMTVKGLSGNIGASQVHATAKLMDRLIRMDQYDAAAALLPLLTEKYHLFKNKIESEYLTVTKS
jgi:PAS domain S-box-containing protein